jgi:hypothetical protein
MPIFFVFFSVMVSIKDPYFLFFEGDGQEGEWRGRIGKSAGESEEIEGEQGCVGSEQGRKAGSEIRPPPSGYKIIRDL